MSKLCYLYYLAELLNTEDEQQGGEEELGVNIDQEVIRGGIR